MLKSPNHRVAFTLGVLVVGMVALAYVSVPLYRLFCQMTGFAGTTQRADKAPVEVVDRIVTVRFNANLGPGLDWEIAPLQNTMDVKLGENGLAFYRVTNKSDKAVVGTATYNVTPDQAGGFFNKIQCFCFTEQRLEPGESAELPVSFFVDPAIMNDPDGKFIRYITLSYTFYPVANPKGGVVGGQPPVTESKSTKG